MIEEKCVSISGMHVQLLMVQSAKVRSMPQKQLNVKLQLHESWTVCAHICGLLELN